MHYMYRYIVKIHCAGKRPGPAVLTGDLFYIIYLEITYLEIVIINMQDYSSTYFSDYRWDGGSGRCGFDDIRTGGESTYVYVGIPTCTYKLLWLIASASPCSQSIHNPQSQILPSASAAAAAEKGPAA